MNVKFAFDVEAYQNRKCHNGKPKCFPVDKTTRAALLMRSKGRCERCERTFQPTGGKVFTVEHNVATGLLFAWCSACNSIVANGSKRMPGDDAHVTDYYRHQYYQLCVLNKELKDVRDKLTKELSRTHKKDVLYGIIKEERRQIKERIFDTEWKCNTWFHR